MATAIGTAEASRPEPLDAPRLPPGILKEARLLQRMGFSKPLIRDLAIKAMRNATTLEAELLAAGMVRQETYYEALAEMAGLSFLATIDPARVHDVDGADTQLVRPTTIRLVFSSRPPITAMVPSASRFEELCDMLDRMPALRGMLVATSPAALRSALWHAGRHRRVRETTGRLFETMPSLSARVTFWGRQGFYTGLLLSATLAFALLFPLPAILLLHVVLTAFFLAAFLIRLFALARSGQPGRRLLPPEPPKPRPVYSVFVALYREAEVVPQLVGMLERIEWPRSRLDIKLICEADDTETLEALGKLQLRPEYEIVEVPPSFPRTKPKALSYALPAARGDYLVIYDAEDRPHPGQIEEAWRTFEASSDRLACLQAPLIVTNARRSWISALFALEYAALFRGLLPLLAASRLPMPLGGTSNHFRTALLKGCGGWDPYNVTEDADLGMRLFRFGCHCGVLSRPTLEDAPTDMKSWSGQRTRWFKGWLQTWLVLMRSPPKLAGEMGIVPVTVFQVLIGGMLLSSLAHPLVIAYLLAVVWSMIQNGPHSPGPLALTLFVIDMVNIFGSYAIFIALGRAPMNREERSRIGWRWGLTGLYWLMMSVAAWRAVGELRTRPFFWNKTAHRPSTFPTIGDNNHTT